VRQAVEMAIKPQAVLVRLLLSLATACTVATPTPTRTPKPTPTTLNLNLGGEPSSLAPSLATDPVSREVIANLFLGLTGIPHDTGEVIPQLATDWEVSEDGMVCTFHLRDDVYWVRYDPRTGAAEKKRKVSAHDVEYAVRRAIDPATGSDSAYVDYIIQNAEAVNTRG
jgi:oligopeptide transport system substrate-binding protein